MMRSMGEFLFSDTKDVNAITLSPVKGPEMRYGQKDISFVDFPGEYDIRGHVVTCYATDNILHYIVSVDDKRYAIVQNAHVISKEDFDQIDIWVVPTIELQQEIERQELNGKVELIKDEHLQDEEATDLD